MEFIKKQVKFLVVLLSLISLLVMSTASVYAWFTGVGYSGNTMSYNRRISIGVLSADVTNYYGQVGGSGNFVYTEIDPQTGFQHNNLAPGSYIYIQTKIRNTDLSSSSNVSIYLQDITFSNSLLDFLYFGVSYPDSGIENYKNIATYDDINDRYELRSIPLIERYIIEPDDELNLYWYVYIDSSAGQDIGNSSINLGNVAITHN